VEIAIGKQVKTSGIALIVNDRLKVEVTKGFDPLLLKEVIQAAGEL
jgi:hypothetical protein